MENANAEFSHFTFNIIGEYYPYSCDTLLSEGVKALAERFNCYWWLEMIASSYKTLKEEFQIWTLTKHPDHSAIVIATDGLKKVLLNQTIANTDFEALTATIWVQDGILILPSEH